MKGNVNVKGSGNVSVSAIYGVAKNRNRSVVRAIATIVIATTMVNRMLPMQLHRRQLAMVVPVPDAAARPVDPDAVQLLMMIMMTTSSSRQRHHVVAVIISHRVARNNNNMRSYVDTDDAVTRAVTVVAHVAIPRIPIGMHVTMRNIVARVHATVTWKRSVPMEESVVAATVASDNNATTMNNMRMQLPMIRMACTSNCRGIHMPMQICMPSSTAK